MNQPPLVSVIIPAYNAAVFIERTLRSVLSQTYENLEVLVIDDGSQDQTPEIIQRIAQEDKRVRLIQQVNSGVAAARNLGIQKSQGEFIAPIDADDIWYPENIEKQVSGFLKSDSSVGLIYSWSVDIDESDSLIGEFRAANIEGEVYSTLVCHNFLGNASATMIRRTCLEKVGIYNDNMRLQNAQGCEDWDLYLRIAEHYQFRVIPEFLVGYRKLTISMSADYEQMARSHDLILRSVEQKYPLFPTVIYQLSRSNLYIYFAHQSHRCNQKRKTLSWIYKALKSNWLFTFLRLGLYRILIINFLLLAWSSSIFFMPKSQEKLSHENKLASTDLAMEDIEKQNLKLFLILAINNLFNKFIKTIANNSRYIEMLSLSKTSL